MTPPIRKISVVMALRNGMPYLAEQLSSLFAQTIPVQEIVICDDASTDDSAACVKAFEAEHPGVIRFFQNDAPLGSTENFEKALSLVTGDLIFFCDQDDLWLPRRCEEMAALFPEDPSDTAAVFCDSLLVDEAGHPTGERYWALRGFPELSQRSAGVLADQLELFCRRVPCAGHEMALNRAAKCLFLPFPALENSYDTWIGMAGAAHGCWRICPQALTLFRQHAKNASGAGKRRSLREQWKEAKRSVKENTFRWNAHLFGELLTRFPDLPLPVRQLLEARKDHSLARTGMTGTLFHRLPLIFREWRSGNYARFGRGWKSLLQDLLLPREQARKE